MRIPRPASMFLVAAASVMSAKAATLGELQAEGFRIVRISTIPGTFTGCLKLLDWALTDGSGFVCHENWRTILQDPNAVLLQTPDDDHVLLIGGHAYIGSMIRLGDRSLGTPVALKPIDASPPRTPSQEQLENHINPSAAIDSINQLREGDHLRINAAQRYVPVQPDLNTGLSKQAGEANELQTAKISPRR